MVLMPAVGSSLPPVHFVFLKNVVWTWLVCFLCMSAQGQQATSAVFAGPVVTGGCIEGTVRDAESGEPLPMASVRLLNAPFSGMADLGGVFRLANLPTGRHTLVASYLGYQDLVLENVEVADGRPQWLAVTLQPVSLPVGEVVVTASSRSQAIKLAPASIGVITNKQLQERQITTFDQAFDDMPGVVVTRSGGANVQAFSIRGASEVAGGGIGNRVLLLIDGRPALSPESGGALWNLVPISSIERIEVVRGAYSSLYGSSAMGGVVNVITRKPDAAPQTRLHLNYGAYNCAPESTGYNRYNDFHSVDVSHSRQIGKFSYLLDGSWKSDDGHKEKTGFDLYNFFAKTTWAFSPRRTIQLSANANRMYSDAPATWRTAQRNSNRTTIRIAASSMPTCTMWPIPAKRSNTLRGFTTTVIPRCSLSTAIPATTARTSISASRSSNRTAYKPGAWAMCRRWNCSPETTTTSLPAWT
jgi:outer membrane receptor protein involved in Fe transport